MRLVYDTFCARITIDAVHAFSDSVITLHWINGSPSRWKSFVANRVNKIQNLLLPSHWFHVNGQDNPADCVSRGMSPSEFCRHSSWLTGPQWLKENEQTWPITSFTEDNQFSVEE